jgi:hypothetical protein
MRPCQTRRTAAAAAPSVGRDPAARPVQAARAARPPPTPRHPLPARRHRPRARGALPRRPRLRWRPPAAHLLLPAGPARPSGDHAGRRLPLPPGGRDPRRQCAAPAGSSLPPAGRSNWRPRSGSRRRPRTAPCTRRWTRRRPRTALVFTCRSTYLVVRGRRGRRSAPAAAEAPALASIAGWRCPPPAAAPMPHCPATGTRSTCGRGRRA